MLQKEYEFILYSKGYIPNIYGGTQVNPHSSDNTPWYALVCEWIDGSKDKFIYLSKTMRDSDLKQLKELYDK